MNTQQNDPIQELVQELRRTLTPARMASSPLVNPTPYSGTPEQCKGFLLQCSLALEMQPARFPTERSRMAYIVSLLTGRALQWAEGVWSHGGPMMDTLDSFLAHFTEVFGIPEGDSLNQAKLHAIRQGKSSVTDYALQFRTLAAASGWNEAALLTTFRQGLEPSLRLQLSAYDDAIGLDRFIQLAIRVSHRRESCLQDLRTTPSAHAPSSTNATSGSPAEPMQVNTTRLTPAERQKRMSQGLCLYCGGSNHLIAQCTVRPPRPLVSTVCAPEVHFKPLTTPVTLTHSSSSYSVAALIDSGSAGNFISGSLCRRLQLPRVPCNAPFNVNSIVGKPLTRKLVQSQTKGIVMRVGFLHVEAISLYVLEDSTAEVILGRPWLVKHSPTVCWETGEILSWGDGCITSCCPELPVGRSPQPITLNATSIESPHQTNPVDIPSAYDAYKDVFCPQRASQLPPHRPWDCCIDLIPGQPLPHGRIYPLSLPEQQAMKDYIEEASELGYIRPSKSPVASPFFFITKKDGGLRPCIDYRGLNQITVKFRYPLPLVPAALERLRGANIFSKLDLRSAYNLVRIRQGDEWKTGFVTPTGHYEYLVMPYGLSNAPSVFQGFMNEVFRDYLNQFVIVFMDDILVFSPNISEHIKHVTQVLTKLREFHLFLKAEKCMFHLSSVQFLGYNISPEGISMDEGKVSTVLSWPVPKTVKDLQRFLGFANFHRRFIENYSLLSAPLTSLLRRKPKTLSWNPEASQAFQNLKEAFTTAPILRQPDPDQQFIVEVDASSSGIGGVLSQHHGNPPRLHPCAYFSRKLSSAESNYDIGNRELLAIKLALEEWRHWLEGSKHPFLVLTDHKNLQYLRDAKRLNPRQARWALFFTRFTFTISYRPGSRNCRADALSRIHSTEETLEQPETIIPAGMVVSPIQWALDDQIAAATEADPAPPNTPANLTFVPRSLRTQLLTAAHSSPGTGHPGTAATVSLLRGRYWWPGLAKDVQRFVAGCAECAMTKSPRHLPAGKLVPLPIPQRPWSHLGVDYITDLPPSDGNTCVLVIVDRFSKSCKLIPLPGLPTASETAEALFTHIFRNFGIPEDIVSDRGPQFISRFWKAFLHLMGVTVSLTSGYHPQSNGQTERKIQEVSRFLRTFCHNQQNDWCKFLPWAEYAQNSLRQPSTGLTPFQCVLGHQPPLFPWSGEPSEVPAVNTWFRESQRVWSQAHRHLQRAVRRQQHHADTRRSTAPDDEVGQKVWLSTRDIRMRLPSKKLSPKFIGPFTIVKQLSPVTYRLQLPPEYRIHPAFHVSLLKPYHSPHSPSSTEPGAVSEPPLPLLLDEGPVYAIREVLDSRRRRGRLQYLIDWEGYGPEDQSWVGRDDILDPSLLAEFHRSHPSRPAPRRRGRPLRRAPSSSVAPPGGGGIVTARPGSQTTNHSHTTTLARSLSPVY